MLKTISIGPLFVKKRNLLSFSSSCQFLVTNKSPNLELDFKFLVILSFKLSTASYYLRYKTTTNITFVNNCISIIKSISFQEIGLLTFKLNCGKA